MVVPILMRWLSLSRHPSSKEPKDIVESYKLGVNSYIVKSVSSERFVSAVQELGVYWLRLNQRPVEDTLWRDRSKSC